MIVFDASICCCVTGSFASKDSYVISVALSAALVTSFPGTTSVRIFLPPARSIACCLLQLSTFGRLPQRDLNSEYPFDLSVGLLKYQSDLESENISVEELLPEEPLAPCSSFRPLAFLSCFTSFLIKASLSASGIPAIL